MVLVAVPAVVLNELGQYRSNVERVYMDHTLVLSEYEKSAPEYAEKLTGLEIRLRRADWFAPAWLVGNDDLPWMAVMYGPLQIYVMASIALLRRSPQVSIHDRISGTTIVRL